MEYGNGEKNHLVWHNKNNKYHNPTFDILPNNNNVNVAMLSQYINNGDNVLDIGCGEGKLGAILKNKNCNLVGVDLDECAGKYAEENNGYQKVYIANFETISFDEQTYINIQQDGKFDCIALIDILEHAVNPTKIIENLVPLLHENGKILISIPNVNNMDIILNLMRDRFNYQESGVLDNTHTKFFTRTSFEQWISEINQEYSFSFLCKYVGSTYGYTDYMIEVKNKLPFVFAFMEQNPYFHAIQHLFILEYLTNEVDNSNLQNNEISIDLTKNLNDILAGNRFSENISLLPNERKNYEERIEKNTAGWNICNEALLEAQKYIFQLEETVIRKQDYIEDVEERLISAKNDIEEGKKYIDKLESDIEYWRKQYSEISYDFVELKEYSEKLKKDLQDFK